MFNLIFLFLFIWLNPKQIKTILQKGLGIPRTWFKVENQKMNCCNYDTWKKIHESGVHKKKRRTTKNNNTISNYAAATVLMTTNFYCHQFAASLS
jgi:hypothetical protein